MPSATELPAPRELSAVAWHMAHCAVASADMNRQIARVSIETMIALLAFIL